ncbi:hypothetical protein VPH35_038501 [Triticum aestivum]|uniref:Uncharacterized protein n=1 Tax=Aegilops tauschii subsp. strangulata TaxID=200361 RepID=A0A453CDU6_AEGTS
MVVAVIVCGGAVADVQEASMVSVLHRPCLSSVCSSSQVAQEIEDAHVHLVPHRREDGRGGRGPLGFTRRRTGGNHYNHHVLLQAFLASSHDQHGEHRQRAVPNQVREERPGRPSPSNNGDNDCASWDEHGAHPLYAVHHIYLIWRVTPGVYILRSMVSVP